MYSCLYDTCADMNLSLYVCRDGLWRTSSGSLRGSFSQTTTGLTRLWVDGNPPRAFLTLDTLEAYVRWWSLLMSSGGRTSLDEM